MLEVQNVMSKHAYYHSAGRNYEELADIWVQHTPNPTFSNPHGSWVGMDHIRAACGELNRDNQARSARRSRTEGRSTNRVGAMDAPTAIVGL